ncbi:hypothetical protein [Nannocystis sp.]|uniref:hypothetical protein n=1 Tax=Nannocystis sp. TaxID=1962667 RepID=UPI002601073F|nr:hypothetical protein [Nannocystis sp.]MBK7829746.1 hypothetical protein [Nannocystis sp.]
MMNLGHRITTLFFLNLLTLGCDADDGLIDLDDPGAFDDERDAPAAFDDERDAPEAIDDERDEPRADPGGKDLAAAPAEARHCVVEATVVPDGVVEAQVAPDMDPDEVPAVESEMTCFSRFSEAIFFATGEQLADDATPETYGPDTIASAPRDPSATTYVAGVEYQYDNWGGKSLTVTATASCLTATITLNKFSDPWWDNTVSSARAYSGCKHSYHYEDKYLGGAMKDCGTSCWYIGAALQNRTSSIRWTK